MFRCLGIRITVIVVQKGVQDRGRIERALIMQSVYESGMATAFVVYKQAQGET